MENVAIIILAHDNRLALEDMVKNVRYFCPNATLALYNSGDDPSLGENLDVILIPSPRRLYYARIIHFFFDLFQWLESINHPFDYVVNIDSDVLFIRHGFPAFLYDAMIHFDYMAPNFRKFTSPKSRWRPFRSLKPELNDWYNLLGFNYTHQAFNPGQTFSRNYIMNLLKHPKYENILNLVDKNKSFTLHEVLFPTLLDFLNLDGRSYPDELTPIIRYRPYQAVSGVRRALSLPNAYFVHPVRREIDNPARVYIRNLITD